MQCHKLSIYSPNEESLKNIFNKMSINFTYIIDNKRKLFLRFPFKAWHCLASQITADKMAMSGKGSERASKPGKQSKERDNKGHAIRGGHWKSKLMDWNRRVTQEHLVKKTVPYYTHFLHLQNWVDLNCRNKYCPRELGISNEAHTEKRAWGNINVP